jgi:hypothetical protein
MATILSSADSISLSSVMICWNTVADFCEHVVQRWTACIKSLNWDLVCVVGCTCAIKPKVTLRPKIRRPFCLSVKSNLGHETRFLLLSAVGLFMLGALTDERTGLSFTIAAVIFTAVATLSWLDALAIQPQGGLNSRHSLHQLLYCGVTCSLPWKRIYQSSLLALLSGLSAAMSQYCSVGIHAAYTSDSCHMISEYVHWRWRQYVPSKRRWPPIRLHGVIT